jgi:hypothetical protein
LGGDVYVAGNVIANFPVPIGAVIDFFELLLERELSSHLVLISMPKIAVNKYRKFSTWNDNIWFARKCPIADSEAANPIAPESLPEQLLRLGDEPVTARMTSLTCSGVRRGVEVTGRVLM